MRRNTVPDILIEQYVLGELSETRAREVEQSPGFAERVAEIERSNEEILTRYPAPQFAARIRNQFEAQAETSRAATGSRAAGRRTGAERGSLRWLALALPGAAAVAVATIFAVQGFVGGAGGADRAVDEIVRLKGSDPSLLVYRSVEGPSTRDDEAEALPDGAEARAGDRLQLAYNAGDHRYGAIVSVDGRGVVTLHFPLTMSDDPRLEVGRTQRLPYGYQLDDAPRFERFYFIASDAPFSVQQLVQTVRAQSPRIAERADYSLVLGDVFGDRAMDDVDVVSVTIAKGE